MMIPGFTVFCWTLAAFMGGTLFEKCSRKETEAGGTTRPIFRKNNFRRNGNNLQVSGYVKSVKEKAVPKSRGAARKEERRKSYEEFYER